MPSGIKLHYVQSFVNHGKRYYYFRRYGSKLRRVRLHGKPGSPEFMRAYRAALAAAQDELARRRR